jgi:hypothetical protein
MSRFAAYAERRDPVLGWSHAAPGSPDATVADESGARRLPAFPDPAEPACISAYGDSFTWGSEVADEHTWANFLARRLRCRITDYAVPAYGTDQAYLRYLGKKSDVARVVLLGIYSDDVPRNVNRYRALVSPNITFGLKPRFVLDERGELVLLPVPLPDEAGMRAISEEAGSRLEHEYFQLGGPESLRRWEFPHALSLLRVAASWRTRQRLMHRALHEPFFDPAHPSGALPLTVAIAAAFQREAAQRGAFGAVMVIPAWEDMDAHRRTGRWIYQPLLDALAARGIPALDVGERLSEAPANDEYCSLYVGCRQGHFTPVAHRRMADAVHDWLAKLGKP